MDESLDEDMMSHDSSIPCPHLVVLTGDTVSIEQDDIEWASWKASSHQRHSLARFFGLALSILCWVQWMSH